MFMTCFDRLFLRYFANSMEIFIHFSNLRYSGNLSAPLIHRHLVGKSIRIEGFLVTALMRDPTKLRKAMADMIGWYKEVT